MHSRWADYMYNDTFVHKLDPRLKICTTVIYIVLCFVAKDFVSLAILFVPLIILYLIGTKKISSALRRMIMPIIIGLFIFWVNVFTMKPDKDTPVAMLKVVGNLPIDIGNGYYITWEVIMRTLGLMFRVYIMILVTSLMINTIKPAMFSRALEDLFLPLRLLFIPTHIIVMIIYITLRFIPTILDEAQRITKAQSSRGVDFKNGRLKDKVKSFTTLIIPLFVSAFAKAEDLSNAMEIRGYDPYERRTHYRLLIPTWRDIILFMLLVNLIIYIALVNSEGSNPLLSTSIWQWIYCGY